MMYTNAPLIKCEKIASLGHAVSPYHSMHLVSLGVRGSIYNTYEWKVDEEDTWMLDTCDFDPCEVYKNSNDIVRMLGAVPIKLKFPAFLVCDMLVVLPNLFIAKDDANYTVSCDQMYGELTITDARLPDALARILIGLLENRTLNDHYVNKKLNII